MNDLFRRFESKVEILTNGCHEWKSTIRSNGYAHFWFNGEQVLAHRMAWLLYCDEIPSGKLVLHTCDNRKCVNPEHLYIGDAKDNAQDRTERLRYGCSKLDEIDVHNIKECYRIGGYTQQKLADLYGVHQGHISRIILKKQRALR